MNQELETLSELLIENKEVIKSSFRFSYNYMLIMGASLLANKGVLVSKEEIEECRSIIKRNSSAFSYFRGSLEIPMTAKMILSDDPEEYFSGIKSISERLENNKFFKSYFAVVAAIIIYDRVENKDFTKYINKTKLIYEQMKRDHSILTSNDDIVFAALLAVSNIDVDNLLLEMDECYRLLKSDFNSFNNQELSHILALDVGAPGLKVKKFIELYQGFKAEKLNFGKSYGAIALAVLSLLDIDADEALYQVSKTHDFLLVQKGFSGWHMVKSERLSYAALLVTKAYKPYDEVIENVLLYVNLRRMADAQAASSAAAVGH